MNHSPLASTRRQKRHVRRAVGSIAYAHPKAFDDGHSKPFGWRKTFYRRRQRRVGSQLINREIARELRD